ncbi:MAG: M15 family metallopeptidase [Myxococcales bacterium]|nr:M15 family metallopeptidase [Myxococcales bacterium]
MPGSEEHDVHEEPSEEPDIVFFGSTKVKDVINVTCSTATVRGLAVQIADEMACMRPTAFAKFSEGGNIDFVGASVLPYMSPQAATALKKVARTRPLQIISGFRTVVQQYVLYKWYLAGRCGIPVAAKPGRSNHETGRAVDLNNYTSARATMRANGWRDAVAGDPAHFDHQASADLRGLDVQAFQRLWNRNNPGNTISVDGVWGPQTATALANSPSGGFARGAFCM